MVLVHNTVTVFYFKHAFVLNSLARNVCHHGNMPCALALCRQRYQHYTTYTHLSICRYFAKMTAEYKLNTNRV